MLLPLSFQSLGVEIDEGGLDVAGNNPLPVDIGEAHVCAAYCNKQTTIKTTEFIKIINQGWDCDFDC